MFGVDRPITTFQLDVRAATTDQLEGCTAWASVSYTAEVDFRNETKDYILQFYLAVAPTTFERLVWDVAQGMVEVMFSVGHVDGFYSEWSPSISTTSIKVLAGSEHIVDGEPKVGLPRVGIVGKTDLYMSARRKIPQPTYSVDEAAEVEEIDRQQKFRWPGRRS